MNTPTGDPQIIRILQRTQKSYEIAFGMWTVDMEPRIRKLVWLRAEGFHISKGGLVHVRIDRIELWACDEKKIGGFTSESVTPLSRAPCDISTTVRFDIITPRSMCAGELPHPVEPEQSRII